MRDRQIDAVMTDEAKGSHLAVEHLGIGEGRAVHELTEFAVVGPDHALMYFPVQGRLPGITSSGTDDASGRLA